MERNPEANHKPLVARCTSHGVSITLTAHRPPTALTARRTVSHDAGRGAYTTREGTATNSQAVHEYRKQKKERDYSTVCPNRLHAVNNQRGAANIKKAA